MRVDLDRILPSLSIVDLLPPGTTVRSSGRAQWFAKCPLHEDKTASMSIRRRPDRFLFHCFGCHEQGDAVDFLEKLHGLDKRGAIEMIGQGWGALASDTAAVTPRRNRPPPPWLLVCSTRGCTAQLEVETADIPALGVSIATNWWVGYARTYCPDCREPGVRDVSSPLNSLWRWIFASLDEEDQRAYAERVVAEAEDIGRAIDGQPRLGHLERRAA